MDRFRSHSTLGALGVSAVCLLLAVPPSSARGAETAGAASCPAEVPSPLPAADPATPGPALRGIVRDAGGRPVEGALVRAEPDWPRGARPPKERTDAQGGFQMTGLAPGAYLVTVTAPGHARVTVRAEAGGEPLEITLAGEGAISGRLVGPSGRPVRDASVEARARVGPASDAERYEARANPDGSFRLGALASGAYDIEARAEGYAPALRANVRVVAGRATAVGDLTLGRGGVVRGSVVDTAGRGLPGVSVYVETDPRCLTDDLEARTDSTGAFEIRGVPAGLVRVRAEHPSFTSGGAPEVEVDPERETLPIQIVLDRGTRVEGHVYYRDGRPFTAGRVIVMSSHPDSLYGGPDPASLDDDGGFVADHVPPGRGLVHVLAFTPTAAPPFAGPVTTLSPIAVQPVEVREGETATADVVLRDIVVSGRVTRGGQAAAGIRVSVSSGPRRSISFAGLAPLPPAAGPPPLAATTREDGTYELVVFTPGPARVGLAAVSGEGFPPRAVSVPDVDAFTLDLEIADTAVSGVVVDGESGDPLADVSVRLSRADGGAPSEALARSGSDGRFAVGAEVGDYVLSAELPGRVRLVRPVSVGPAGLADVRVELEKGLSIVGRVVDGAGRPAPGHAVVAIGGDGFERAAVRADGTFRIEGLGPGPYALSVGSTLAGFATQRAVRPGPEPVRLTLRPAGKVALQVVSSDGRPVAEAVPSVMSVDGAPVDLRDLTAPPTSEEGSTEVRSPAGEVAIAVIAPSGGGSGSVVVRPGETVPLRIVVLPPPEPRP